MDEEEFGSINSIVYHISNISKSWDLKNYYHLALRDLLLLNESTQIDVNSLRVKQEYHFVAKIIVDELKNNVKNIKNNGKEISLLLKRYLKNKKQKDGDNVTLFLFYIFLLKLLNRDKHFRQLGPKEIKQFLETYQSQNNIFNCFQNVLSLYHSVNIDKITEKETNDDLELSINLLYDRLKLTETSKRDKNNIVDYYIKQTQLEKIDVSSISSEQTKGRLLQISIILKAATGNGLYLPEIEKEQYLSKFTQKIFREKYLKILEDSNSIKIRGISIYNWLAVFLFFLLEALIFSLPNFVESITVFGININTKALAELPIWVIILINGLIMVTYLLIHKYNLAKRIGDEKWK